MTSFSENKKAYALTFVLAMGASIYVYLDNRLNSYLIGPIIYLPFIWIGFGLTIVLVLCLQILGTKKRPIIISVLLFFPVAIFISMFIALAFYNIRSQTDMVIKMSDEDEQCLQNFKNQKKLYAISNVMAKPLYNQQKKISGFTLSLSLANKQSQYQNVRVLPELILNGRTSFYSSSSDRTFLLENEKSKNIIFTLNKPDTRDMSKVAIKDQSVNVYLKISIFDISRNKPPIVFLPKRPFPNELCIRALSNKMEQPIHELTELNLNGYKLEDFESN